MKSVFISHSSKNIAQANIIVDCLEQEGISVWSLIEEIGVFSYIQQSKLEDIIKKATHKPYVKIQKEWYY